MSYRDNCCVQTLSSNGYFSSFTVPALSKYATIWEVKSEFLFLIFSVWFLIVFWDCEWKSVRHLLPYTFLSLYLCAGFGRPLDSYQDRVTAITEATGNCTLKASPLLEINNTTSNLHKLFIYSEAKYYNFICKHGVMWPSIIIIFNDPKWRNDEFIETLGV
jgi:hypothetical protein